MPPEPTKLKAASMESFLLCPTCSEQAGEEVFVHKSHLQTAGGFLRKAEQLCPKGHVIPEAVP